MGKNGDAYSNLRFAICDDDSLHYLHYLIRLNGHFLTFLN